MTVMPGAPRSAPSASSRDGILELDIDRLGMADEDRHAHAGRRDRDIGIEDLARLHLHLPLLLGRAVGHEDVDMGDAVEGDLLGEALAVDRRIGVDGAGLVEELVHRLLAGAGDRLIGGHDHALDPRQIMQRLQRHHHLDGRAIGIGDDVALLVAGDGIGIDLRHDQRHVGIHAELGGIVDDDAAGRRGPGRMHRRDLGPRREQRDIDAPEIEGIEIADLQDIVLAIGDLHPGRAGGGHRDHFLDRKLALRQGLQHLAADIARRTHNRHSVAHLFISLSGRCFTPGSDCRQHLQTKKAAPGAA